MIRFHKEGYKIIVITFIIAISAILLTEKFIDIYWLESVVVSKVGDKWLLSQMHSTRLPQDEIPKGVTFIKQQI